MEKIVPVLLAGGSGTRLWPISRKSYPKQFSNLIGETSLFQQSALRLISSDIVKFSPHVTLTNSDYRFIVGQQLQGVGIDPGPVLIEPEGKNTAPAILAASLYVAAENEDAVVLVSPSDHVIGDIDAFHKVVLSGINAVNDGKIVTFGIKPTRAETGYGYLELGSDIASGVVSVNRFVEKPDLADAQKMVDNGSYLWNAGIFMFRVKDMISAFEAYAPDLISSVQGAIEHGKNDLGFFRLDSAFWSECKNISIDYAVMERSEKLVAIPLDTRWSDLGGWDAVFDEMGPDENGVAVSENAHALNCENTLLRSESSSQIMVGLGLKDIIAVAMPDAVLVVHKDHLHDVRTIIPVLKSRSVLQAETFPKDHRPWGWFETLTIQGRFHVKRIFVHPGAALSLQSHHHRSEHWIVVEGTAKVTIDDDVRLVTEGQSVYIPLGAVHRMVNPGKLPMVLIEVQTGSYLQEDDIIRYEDIYSRS